MFLKHLPRIETDLSTEMIKDGSFLWHDIFLTPASVILQVKMAPPCWWRAKLKFTLPLERRCVTHVVFQVEHTQLKRTTHTQMWNTCYPYVPRPSSGCVSGRDVQSALRMSEVAWTCVIVRVSNYIGKSQEPSCGCSMTNLYSLCAAVAAELDEACSWLFRNICNKAGTYEQNILCGWQLKVHSCDVSQKKQGTNLAGWIEQNKNKRIKRSSYTKHLIDVD